MTTWTAADLATLIERTHCSVCKAVMTLDGDTIRFHRVPHSPEIEVLEENNAKLQRALKLIREQPEPQHPTATSPALPSVPRETDFSRKFRGSVLGWLADGHARAPSCERATQATRRLRMGDEHPPDA